MSSVYDLGELGPFQDVEAFVAPPQLGWFLDINHGETVFDRIYWGEGSEQGSRQTTRWHYRYVYRRRRTSDEVGVNLSLLYPDASIELVNEPHKVEDYLANGLINGWVSGTYDSATHTENHKFVTYDGLILRWDELRIYNVRMTQTWQGPVPGTATIFVENEHRRQFTRGYTGQVYETEEGSRWAEGSSYDDIGTEYYYHSGWHF